jgi:beta-phosphoglucomutase-like phosphatase (HAD superfamily)
MTLKGMILDIDGTLVDTNAAHVEAWRRAFARLGYDVPTDRIIPEIGKGGDQLVPSVLGEDVEKRQGDVLRRLQKEEFLALAATQRFRVFPGTEEIFPALRARDIRTALATSSDDKNLDATLASSGVDLRRLADVVVTRTAGERSKPAPDLVVDAVEKIGLSATECAMVGDTIYDGQACSRAGVVFLGVLSGGTPESALRVAGAQEVWEDVGHLLADLDRAIEIASLHPAAHR